MEQARRHLFHDYKYGAKKRGYVFELSEERFVRLTLSDCFYCGCAPQQSYTPKVGGIRLECVFYNGIDRRNNKVGYTEENSVSCCKYCNLAKSRWTEQEFLDWVQKISRYQNKKYAKMRLLELDKAS